MNTSNQSHSGEDFGIRIAKGERDFAKLFEDTSKKEDLREGKVVQGKVIRIDNDVVTVDIGYKSEGQIPLQQFTRGPNPSPINVGDMVDVFLESVEDESGMIQLSKERADHARAWQDISRACENDEMVEGIVVGQVKGGLSVDIGVKAFLPGSQVDLRPVRNLSSLIGKKFQFKIIKFNAKRGNIVLSRRVLLEKNREKLKNETLGNLAEGMVLKGIVKNLTDYGAFVDLGGIDGLLHITDMSWGRINHPSEMFSIGDEVEVIVLKYDKETERVSLGKKQLTKDPWQEATAKYSVSSRVKGKVVNLADYGAFVELEEGIEGLVHISEMSWTQRIKHPSKVVAVGDTIDAVVLDIDPTNKRISLGMKQIEPNPWEGIEEKYPVGTRLIGKIRNVTDFGVFIGIEEGIDGLVHISDISWTERIKHPSERFAVGQEVECIVLSIDKQNERFSLGIKQITQDPWENIYNVLTPGQSVDGEVTRVTDFGIFVRLPQGLEGLIHVSEISDERVEDHKERFQPGQKLVAEVIALDPKERTIGLSIKAHTKNQESAEMKNYLEKQGRSTSTLGEVFAAAKKKTAE